MTLIVLQNNYNNLMFMYIVAPLLYSKIKLLALDLSRNSHVENKRRLDLRKTRCLFQNTTFAVNVT